jgi:uncharacterized protein (TIGR03000 family)
MYSIALLMALTGGGEVADGHRGGCGGCGGHVASCGCHGGGHQRHHCGGHERHHGCCGQSACNTCASSCNTCAPVSSCGCYGGGYGAPTAAPAHEPIKAMPAPKSTAIAAPATIVVELPADATLKVDGEATTSTSNVRVLVSPELQIGKEYQYTLTAQIVREGKPVQVERNIVVRAGEESRVSLTMPVSVAQR